MTAVGSDHVHLLPLAINYALPYVLLIWSLIFFGAATLSYAIAYFWDTGTGKATVFGMVAFVIAPVLWSTYFVWNIHLEGLWPGWLMWEKSQKEEANDQEKEDKDQGAQPRDSDVDGTVVGSASPTPGADSSTFAKRPPPRRLTWSRAIPRGWTIFSHSDEGGSGDNHKAKDIEMQLQDGPPDVNDGTLPTSGHELGFRFGHGNGTGASS